MKLLHYTYRKLSLLLLLLMTLWGILFYYTIIDEVVDETDDTLQNYGHLLIKKTLREPSMLNTEGTMMSFYKFRPISEEEGLDYREKFYDSTIFIEIEKEYEPVRVMQTAFRMSDGQFYELTLMISILERDDMVRAIFSYLGILFLLFIICTSVGIRRVLTSVFSPLHKLLDWLHNLHPGQEVPPLNNPTRIREFQQLSEAAVAMGNRSYKAYTEQKQFIENASHELQTPLAIVKGKVELLAEDENLTKQQIQILDDIYTTLGRAVKLNKSLLLLSRIENGQYAETKNVSVDDLLDSLLPDLLDIYAYKEVHLSRIHGEHPFIIQCNSVLAQILITNLLKNSLFHNQNNGKLDIITTEHSLIIKNTGNSPLDKNKLFHRFYRATTQKDSTGLGLSIAHSIATASSWTLTYEWCDNMHCFILLRKRSE